MVATGHTSMWAIYSLTTLLGLLLAVERPAMQAILFQLVGPDLLPSAVAANSTINSMSRLVGPALAGALIAGFGVGTCFAVNAASYLVVIGALMRLRRSELIDRPLLGRTKGKLREGFACVRSQPDVRRPLLVMAVVGTMALNFQTTFPSMVRFEFELGAGSIGTAMSVSAIGSILGGIYIAGMKPDGRRTLGIVLAAFATTCIALALAPGYWAFVALTIPLGFASASFQSVDTVVLQQATEPSMQGRVMALQQMAWFGSTPIGALLMGWIIQVSSPRVPFAVGGVSALACAAAVLLVRRTGATTEDGRWVRWCVLMPSVAFCARHVVGTTTTAVHADVADDRAVDVALSRFSNRAGVVPSSPNQSVQSATRRHAADCARFMGGDGRRPGRLATRRRRVGRR
jgi:predicted MFS family arabinose efflux permease